MKKKNLQPQQTAPVERDKDNTTASSSQRGLSPAIHLGGFPTPFAGDDAE